MSDTDMDELSGRTGFEVQATEGIHPEAVWLSLRSAGGLCIEAARRGGGGVLPPRALCWLTPGYLQGPRARGLAPPPP